MESLGYEVSTEVLDAVMKEIDFDGSGEISYDEFCSLMAKMLGPDGDLDIDRFLKNVSEAAVREAKQNQIVEAFPGVQEEVKKHTSVIEKEQNRLTSTNNRVDKMELEHRKLLEEMQKLRKGLDINERNWTGMKK